MVTALYLDYVEDREIVRCLWVAQETKLEPKYITKSRMHGLASGQPPLSVSKKVVREEILSLEMFFQ